MARGVQWYEDRIRQFVVDAPVKAHALAAAQAAGIAAKGIGGQGTGDLARDVATPKMQGPLHAEVGSDLPYAGVQNDGAVIVPRRAKRLLIHGKQSKRSAVRSGVTASADSVTIKGKHYLERAVDAFPALYFAALRRLL